MQVSNFNWEVFNLKSDKDWLRTLNEFDNPIEEVMYNIVNSIAGYRRIKEMHMLVYNKETLMFDCEYKLRDVTLKKRSDALRFMEKSFMFDVVSLDKIEKIAFQKVYENDSDTYFVILHKTEDSISEWKYEIVI